MTDQNTECDENAVSDGGLFYWGEYETIDWERVHAGEASLTTHVSGVLIATPLVSAF